MGLLAGNASMAVSGQLTRDGHDVYHIRSLAESSPFFSFFYYVRDMGETFVDVRELYPWYFHLDQREGERAVQRTVAFDQQRGVAIYTKNQETPQEDESPCCGYRIRYRVSMSSALSPCVWGNRST